MVSYRGNTAGTISYFILFSLLYLIFADMAIGGINGSLNAQNDEHRIDFRACKIDDDNRISLEFGLKKQHGERGPDTHEDTKIFNVCTSFESGTDLRLGIHFTSENSVMITAGSAYRSNEKEEVFLISTERQDLIDEICCYQPTISPSGLCMVFLIGRSSYGMDRFQSGLVALYVFKDSPEKNRGVIQRQNERDPVLVGRPLYPMAYADDRRYFLDDQWGPENPAMHTITSPFLWSPDSTSIVFLAHHARRTYIVRVFIDQDLQGTSIKETCLDFSPAMIRTDAYRILKYRLEHKDDSIYCVRTNKIQWDDAEHILIWPDRHEILLPEVRLPVPR